MTRYFFHLRTGDGARLDDETGSVLSDDHEAELEAIQSVVDLHRVPTDQVMGCSFEIVDQSDRLVATVSFEEAMTWSLRV